MNAEPQAVTPCSGRAERTGAGAWSPASGLGDLLALKGLVSSFSSSPWAVQLSGLGCGQAQVGPRERARGHSVALPWSGLQGQSILEPLGIEKEGAEGRSETDRKKGVS